MADQQRPQATTTTNTLLWSPGVAEVERHAVGAVGALTVKLSERAFKPIFLRFVEWARAAPPPGGPLSNS
jgi:BP28CT (NUC211) domain